MQDPAERNTHVARSEQVRVSQVAGVGGASRVEAAGVQLVERLDIVGTEGDTRVHSRRAKVSQYGVESVARSGCIGSCCKCQLFGSKRHVRVDDGASPAGLELQLVTAEVHILERAEAYPADDQRQRRQSANCELKSTAERPWQPAGYPPRGSGPY